MRVSVLFGFLGPPGSFGSSGTTLGQVGGGCLGFSGSVSGAVLYGFQNGSVRGGSLSGILISGRTSGLGGAIVGAAIGAGPANTLTSFDLLHVFTGFTELLLL